MLVSLIAAVAENRVIGSATGGIPWDLPRDREHFRARTAGRWLLVGRKTYGEMEGWFGDRTPLVLTKDRTFQTFHPSHRVVTSLTEAIDLGEANGAGELVVCGGARVFAAALPWADRLLLTRISLRPVLSDPVHFPDYESSGQWVLCHREVWPERDRGPAACFEVHRRMRK